MTENKHETNNEMEELNPDMSIVTLGINGLNIPIKRQNPT